MGFIKIFCPWKIVMYKVNSHKHKDYPHNLVSPMKCPHIISIAMAGSDVVRVFYTFVKDQLHKTRLNHLVWLHLPSLYILASPASFSSYIMASYTQSLIMASYIVLSWPLIQSFHGLLYSFYINLNFFITRNK